MERFIEKKISEVSNRNLFVFNYDVRVRQDEDAHTNFNVHEIESGHSTRYSSLSLIFIHFQLNEYDVNEEIIEKDL